MTNGLGITLQCLGLISRDRIFHFTLPLLKVGLWQTCIRCVDILMISEIAKSVRKEDSVLLKFSVISATSEERESQVTHTLRRRLTSDPVI